MILSLLIILASLYWLLRETDYLRCNLMPDLSIPIQDTALPKRQSIIESCVVRTMTYPQVDMTQPYWWLSSAAKDNLILCLNCRKKCDKEQWLAVTIPERTIKLGGSTLNLAKQCNIKRAKILKETCRELKRKTFTPKLAPLSLDYSNLLIPQEWIERHANDIIPEPTIELSVNGAETHFNGDFKTGCIKEFCLANAEVWELKRKKQRASEITA